MKKIITLLLSIMLILSFSITSFAENDDLAGTVPGDETSSDTTSAGDGDNLSSEDQSSSSENESSSDAESSSEDESSSETTTSSQPETESKKITVQLIELPKKTNYAVGETLDLTGLVVNIIKDGNLEVSRDGKGLTVSPTKLNTVGEQKIDVKYQEVSVYFTVKVSDHKFGAWEIGKEATCKSEGSKIRKCKDCDYAETQVVEKLSHDWDEGNIIKVATENTAGVIRYSCTMCKETKDETIPVLNETEEVEVETEEKFKLQLEWWMIFAPVGLIIIGYAVAIVVIFKKKS